MNGYYVTAECRRETHETHFIRTYLTAHTAEDAALQLEIEIKSQNPYPRAEWDGVFLRVVRVEPAEALP